MDSSHWLTGHWVATAVGAVLNDESDVQLRLHAALTLGGLTDVAGVLLRLCAASLAQDDLIDVRYAAFTSIERAGPTPESIAIMRQIARDEALGDAARSVMSAWHVAQPHLKRGGTLNDNPDSTGR